MLIKRKTKWTAGKAHKPRCGIKRYGGKCPCGQYGKKKIRLRTEYPNSYSYFDPKIDLKFLKRVRKWRIKEQIRNLRLNRRVGKLLENLKN